MAYPGGGGAYTVAKHNLGEKTALLAAAALALDYILNAAVAVSAGVGALVSAVPSLLPQTLPLCLLVLVFLTFLKPARPSPTGTAFLLPTYLFVATVGGVLVFGVIKAVLAGGAPPPVEPPSAHPVAGVGLAGASAWVLMRAFASGCKAMTGVEAVSNGVPIFREPTAKTARRTLGLIGRILAGDRYLPEPFLHRGRRLAFSHGVVVLALLAGLLLVAFGGITEGLISLFAIGALSAFTLSQSGMVAHWRKDSGPRARRAMMLNAAGAVATGATLLVVLLSKFGEGAWISVFLVGFLLLLFRGVRRHYDFSASATRDRRAPGGSCEGSPGNSPLRRWDAVSLKALRFALGISPDVTAVQVLTGDREVDYLEQRWSELVAPLRTAGVPPPKLVVLPSRRVAAPARHAPSYPTPRRPT